MKVLALIDQVVQVALQGSIQGLDRDQLHLRILLVAHDQDLQDHEALEHLAHILKLAMNQYKSVKVDIFKSVKHVNSCQ